MKKILAVFLLVLMIMLVGCRDNSAPRPATDPDQDSAPPAAETTATAVPPTETPSAVVEASPTAEPTVEPPTPESSGNPQEEAISPSLFAGSWDDRDIYLSGLVPDETGVLHDLPGATIYHMTLDISDPNMTVGKMEARYTNQENTPLDELVLHLFPGALGGDIDLSDIRLDGEMAESQIDGGNLRVKLEEPLDPGEQTVLSLGFLTTVPGEESTKYKVLAFEQNVLALAHFYPMFAVYDSDGWHDEPTADHGDETFADMSFYLVRVDAPLEQVIAASGVEVLREGVDGKQRVTYAAGPVRDFYLAASDDFDVVQQKVGPVLLSSYAPPELIEGAQLALEVTAQSLKSFSERYGPYPYSELDVVSTPTDALGIEYPGIFANALRIYDLSAGTSGLPNAVLLESTAAHEAAHQWFYNLIGNDQLNEPWLDESTAQYATYQYYVDSYGEQNAQGFYSSLEGRWARADNAEIPIGKPADAYTGLEYGAIVYGRGPIFLNELAQLMGQDAFDDFLRDYAGQYRWQIAYTEDFQRLAEQHCDCDLSELFTETVYGN